MDPQVSRVFPQHAFAVYLEPLAVGRRVVVIGDASLGLGALLAKLGARAVSIWDPDVARARFEAERAPAGVIVRPFMVDGAPKALHQRGQSAQVVEERDGAFDLAVVPNLELFADADDLLALVRRLVGADGVALIAAPNREASEDPAAFDYYELFDLVAREFEQVTMIAQLPFYGVALAELGEEGEESPAVSVDTQLAGGNRTPTAFVAVASERAVPLDPYAIFELPEEPPPMHQEGEEVQVMRAALVHERQRAEAVEGQLAQLALRFAEGERGAVAAQRLLEDALRDRSLRVAELETRIAHSARELAALSVEVDNARAAAKAEHLRATQLAAVVHRAEEAERALRAIEPELVHSGEAHAVEIARYEEALRERAQAIRLLEAELLRRGRIVRELVDALADVAPKDSGGTSEGTQSEPDVLAEENARLHHRLDELALDLARREGEAQAAAWTLAEVERRLETAGKPSSAVAADGAGATDGAESEADTKLAAALDELDVLRRALAQEHEARVRAESAAKFASPAAEVLPQEEGRT